MHEGRRQPRAEPKLSLSGLQRSALWHLQRRTLTEHELRAVLARKADRAQQAHGTSSEAAAWIDHVIERLQENCLLNDARVAESRAARDAGRGRSRRLITQRLRQQGIAADIVAKSTGDVDDEAAASAYIRRRRLTTKDRQKALASLARQGFPFDVARHALDRAIRDG
jgi:SOS response regulatory protein OraA/RecX